MALCGAQVGLLVLWILDGLHAMVYDMRKDDGGTSTACFKTDWCEKCNLVFIGLRQV